MKRFLYILIAYWSLGVSSSIAQDIHFSQYYNMPLTTNPAMTGLVNGEFRVQGIYRNQWWNTGNFGKPAFSTPGLTFDMPIQFGNSRSGIGIGATLLNDQSGGGLLNDFHGAISLSYLRRLNNDHQISFGLEPYCWSRNFSDDMQFASDLLGSGQQSINAFNTFVMDVNAGVFYTGKILPKWRMYSGLTLYNLAQSTINIQDLAAMHNLRYSVQIGSEVEISPQFRLLPSFVFMRQLNVDQLNAGMAILYQMNDVTSITTGVYVRSNDWIQQLRGDAVIPYIGLDHKRIRAGLSYDYTISDFQNQPDHAGGLELSLRYVHQVRYLDNLDKLYFCPRF